MCLCNKKKSKEIKMCPYDKKKKRNKNLSLR